MTATPSQSDGVAEMMLEREIWKSIRDRLASLTVGTCNCLTMSPDIKFHTANCLYRTAQEALDLMPAIAPDASLHASSGEAVAPADAAFKLFTYTRTFNAIAAATSIEAGGIGVSVKAFIEAFGPVAAPPVSQPVAVTDEMVHDALHATVPGGAEVWHWLPQEQVDEWRAQPHRTAHEVMRSALEAALVASHGEGRG